MTKLNFEQLRVHSRLSADRRRYGPTKRERGGSCAPGYGPLPPNLNFDGSYARLKNIVENIGQKGRWSDSGQNKVFRTEEGAIMNWAPTKGTIWFQGKQPFVRDLYEAIVAELGG